MWANAGVGGTLADHVLQDVMQIEQREQAESASVRILGTKTERKKLPCASSAQISPRRDICMHTALALALMPDYHPQPAFLGSHF
jgi:hypothetical protein